MHSAIRLSMFLMLGGLVVGCSQPSAPAVEAPAAAPQPAAAPPRTRFDEKTRIPVRLTLRPTSQGGRLSPVTGGFRPEVVFAADGSRTSCGIVRGAVARLAPGETHDVALRCRDDVQVRMDALGFSVLEDGREIGKGVVLP